ncbi:MAG: hypothetical protein ACI4TI_01130 [Christensenellales bacterium]
MDFENFCNNEELKLKANEIKNNSSVDYEKLINKYKNKSESELYDELMKVASSQKAKGNLNKKQLDEIYNSLCPMLNKTEQDKLKKLIETIGG